MSLWFRCCAIWSARNPERSFQVVERYVIGRQFDGLFPCIWSFCMSTVLPVVSHDGMQLGSSRIFWSCCASLSCRLVRRLSQYPWTWSGPRDFQFAIFLDLFLMSSLVIIFVLFGLERRSIPSVFPHMLFQNLRVSCLSGISASPWLLWFGNLRCMLNVLFILYCFVLAVYLWNLWDMAAGAQRGKMAPRTTNKFGAPMFDPELFRKQIYCIQGSTCDTFGAFRRPGIVPPAPPRYAPAWLSNFALHFLLLISDISSYHIASLSLPDIKLFISVITANSASLVPRNLLNTLVQ